MRLLLGVGLVAGLTCFLPLAHGDDYQLIIRGKVTLPDGSPPPKAAGIQRVCDDIYGSAPGVLTNRKGEYLWRMDVDPMRTRVCHLEATLAGYASTAIDISNLNGYTKTEIQLPPIILSPKGQDPYTINASESDVPGHSRSAWKAAMKALDSGNIAEVENQLQEVVKDSPKFARGWHTLGLVLDNEQKLPAARDAYQHAIDADPKLLPAYVTLAHVCDRLKDWECAKKAAETLIESDNKRLFPEIYLHEAIAQYELKDLDGAKTSAETAIQRCTAPDVKKKAARAEFVLAKVYSAKGDYAAARDHLSKYLAEDPNTLDIEQLKAYLQVLGKPEGAGVDPPLELP